MDVTVHAILLLLMPIIGTMSYVVSRRGVAGAVPVLRAIITSGILMIGIFVLTARPYRGVPWSQCLIGSFSIGLVLAGRRGGYQYVTVLLMLATTAILSHQYERLTETRWIGDVVLHETTRRGLNESTLREAREVVKMRCRDDRTSYPSGWLAEMPFAQSCQNKLETYALYKDEVTRCWHSWFTRLFRYSKVPLSIWFPGGQPAEAADSMVLRESPPPAPSQSGPKRGRLGSETGVTR